jgi:diaminohydroxyphosphoribosylaminopyrimidine deaminase / 5-amino-6-(5-phosphoribosylamino)uracil reductase
VRLIYPPQAESGDDGPADLTRPDLAQLYSYPDTGQVWVRANMVASADGAATIAGRSAGLSSDGDRSLFALLRTLCDVILVGAGTARADDPALTVRDAPGRDPLRIILGRPPEGARVHPARVHEGALEPLLDDLGRGGVVQLLVEGGARVAASFHRGGLVDQYVLYLAPVLLGGDDGVPLFAGPGAPTMTGAWRGRIADLRRLGPDLRIDLLAGDVEGAVP